MTINIKKSTNNFIKRFLPIIIILFIVGAVYGQPGDPDDGGPCPGFPNCVPIDGGLGFLIAAGVTFFGKMLWKKSINTNNQDLREN